MNDSPIDLENLRKITGGDKDIEDLLLEEFISSSNKLITELKENYENENYKDLKVSLHSLRGICMNLNADHLVELCQAIEKEEIEVLEKVDNFIEGVIEEHLKITSYIRDNYLK